MPAIRFALIATSLLIVTFLSGCGDEVAAVASHSPDALPEPLTASSRDPIAQASHQETVTAADFHIDQPCTFEYTVNVTMFGHQSPPQTIIVKALERLQVDDRAYTKWVTPDLDGAITTRYVRVSHDGIHALSGNWERLIVPFPISIGSRWDDESFGECVVDGFEDVVVPAGQYSRCLKIRYSRTLPDGSKLTGQRYVARGVGDVRFTEAVPGAEAELILKTRTVAASWVEGSVDDTHSALCEAQTLIGRWYSRCDDSLITSGPKEFSNYKRLLEWKEVNCRSITADDVNVFGQDAIRHHSTISDADRMNGIDVKSVIAFYSTAFREGSMGGEWGKWQTRAPDEEGKARPFAIVTVRRENGKMIADLLHSGDQTLEHGYEPVNCDWIVAIQQHRANEGTRASTQPAKRPSTQPTTQAATRPAAAATSQPTTRPITSPSKQLVGMLTDVLSFGFAGDSRVYTLNLSDPNAVSEKQFRDFIDELRTRYGLFQRCRLSAASEKDEFTPAEGMERKFFLRCALTTGRTSSWNSRSSIARVAALCRITPTAHQKCIPTQERCIHRGSPF